MALVLACPTSSQPKSLWKKARSENVGIGKELKTKGRGRRHERGTDEGANDEDGRHEKGKHDERRNEEERNEI